MHCCPFKGTQFVRLQAFAILFNNPINTYFKPNITLYRVFHHIFMGINDITVLNNIIINRKIALYPFNPAFSCYWL